MTREREGVLLCVLSAASFGVMAIFAKYAYRADVNVPTLLALRFSLAAVLFWLLVLRGRHPLPSGRPLVVGLLMGLIGYSVQAELFFSALTRIEAPLASLLLYTYPAAVTLLAFLLGRERPTRRRAAALVVASLGVALVLSTGLTGRASLLGLLLALASGVWYSLYILVVDSVVGGIPPLVLSTLVATGAAVSFGSVGLATGSLSFGFQPLGWVMVLAIAAVSTVLAIVTFFAGVARIGPSTASILSTIEPPVTVLLAALFLGERLGPVQAVGGALVLSAVLILQLRRASADVPAGEPSVDVTASALDARR